MTKEIILYGLLFAAVGVLLFWYRRHVRKQQAERELRERLTQEARQATLERDKVVAEAAVKEKSDEEALKMFNQRGAGPGAAKLPAPKIKR